MIVKPMRSLRLAILLVGVGCARPTVAPPTAANFESEIAQFEAAERARPPAPGGVLFLGSSSFRMWTSLQRDFPDAAVLNRGFGGSTFADALYFAPRIVPTARPRLIVLYFGDNDLFAGRTPEQVAGDYATFVSYARRTLPDARIAFVSIKPSPSRWALIESIKRANALIAEQISRDRSSTYVDVFTPMLGPNGRPVPSLFLPDSLHMTPAGYTIWRARIAPVLR